MKVLVSATSKHGTTAKIAEKAIVLALRVPEGDFRDWEAT